MPEGHYSWARPAIATAYGTAARTMNHNHRDRPVGRRLFTDSVERNVFEDAAGQYVLDAAGRLVPISATASCGLL
jgi:hypothetical protein